MPFIITCSARASISERWLFAASTEEAAKEMFWDGDTDRILLSDQIEGDEEDREITQIEELSDEEAALVEPTKHGLEFWIATVEGDDDIHASEIVWGDGMERADVMAIAEVDINLMDAVAATGERITLYGPLLTGRRVR